MEFENIWSVNLFVFIIGFILVSGKDDVENKYLHGKYIAT